MMKLKFLTKTFMFILCGIAIFGMSLCSTQAVEKKQSAEENKKDDDMFRGIWVSTVYNIDYPSKYTTKSEELKKDAVQILDDCSNMGFNAVILQVRPASDAFYKSEIFPWSKYISGTEGVAPDDDFDPLAFWVEEAHKRGMELHAWINPFRVTGAVKKGTDVLSEAAENNVLKSYPDYVVKYTNSKNDESYYLNPSLPEVRQLITEGAVEIVENYDVDGIHIDDYFYPGTDFDDSGSFQMYGKEFSSVDEWRRNNIDLFVKEMSEKLHDADPEIQFGVSPSGIWANKSTNSLGSDTNGFESYSSVYADTRKWASEGWIDYIAPQIYWSVGQSGSDYKIISDWWCDVVKNSKTKLYIGMADYKCVGVNQSNPFYNGNEIKKQMEMNASNSVVKGEIHFAYNSVKKVPELKNKIVAQYADNVNKNNSSAQNVDVSVIIDGVKLEFDQPPIIENSRTLVPMRAIFEALGATVEWLPETEEIFAVCGDKEINMQIGNPNMEINGDKTVSLDVTPKIVASRTLVPLRAVSEVFDADVSWDNPTRTVTIKTNK